MNPRRGFYRTVLGLGAGVATISGIARVQQIRSGLATTQPVLTPDIADLRFTMDNGVKVFHLISEPINPSLGAGQSTSSGTCQPRRATRCDHLC